MEKTIIISLLLGMALEQKQYTRASSVCMVVSILALIKEALSI